MNNRSISNSPHLQELKKKKETILRKKIIFFVLSIIILFVGFVFLSRIKNLNINNIEISGNKIIENKDIENIVNQNISGYYFWFLPKTNFLFYPNKKIKQDLTDNFKRIKNVSIQNKDFENLQINIEEREAKYIWCGEKLPDEISSLDNKPENNQCSFMDESGYVFDSAPYFSDNVYLKIFGEINKEIFPKIILFIENIKQNKIKPIAMFFKNDGDVEIYLNSDKILVNAPKIIFKNNSNFEKILNNLETALDTEPLKTNFNKKYASLLYIDLRFGNKVYYKFANDMAN